jgi:hypothetical protein
MSTKDNMSVEQLVRKILAPMQPLNPNNYPDEASYNDDVGDFEFAVDEAIAALNKLRREDMTGIFYEYSQVTNPGYILMINKEEFDTYMNQRLSGGKE